MSLFIASKNVVLYENGKYLIEPALIEIEGLHIKNVQKIKPHEYDVFVKEESVKRNISIGNYQDRLISPAFVNCHTHIAMNFFKAILTDRTHSRNLMEESFFKIESRLASEDVLAFARIGAYENILNGNALVWDHYYHGTAVAQACLDTGLSAVVAPTLQDVSGPGVPLWEKGIQETEEIHSQPKFSQQGIFAALGPHATDTVSTQLFQQCVTLSNQWNVPIHCHAAQSFEEVERIQKEHSLTPLGFLHSQGVLQNAPRVLLAHGIHLKEADFSFLDKQKNALVFCPFSQMIFQFPANVMQWEERGCSWFIATDCVASNDSMNVQKELRFVAGFPSLKNTFSNEKVLYPETKRIQDRFSESSFLLQKVFAGPGSFHPKFKAGQISEGALANVVIWDTEHPSFWPTSDMLRSLAMGDTTGAIYTMFVAGKKMGGDGNFVQDILNSQEYREALLEAKRRLEILIMNH